MKTVFFLSLCFFINTIHAIEKYGFKKIKTIQKKTTAYDEWIQISNDGKTISFFAKGPSETRELHFLKTITKYNIDTEKITRHPYQRKLPSDIKLKDKIDDIVAYTQNNNILLTLSKDKILTRYDLLNKSSIRKKIDVQWPNICKIALSNNNKLIAITGYDRLTVRKSSTFKTIKNITVKGNIFSNPIFHDVRFILNDTHLCFFKKSYSLKLYNIKSETYISIELPTHYGPVVLSKNKKKMLIVKEFEMSIWETPSFFWDKDDNKNFENLDQVNRIDFITKKIERLHIDTTRFVFKNGNNVLGYKSLLIN